MRRPGTIALLTPGGVELAGGGYERVRLPLESEPTGPFKVTFPAATAAWPEVGAFAVYDADEKLVVQVSFPLHKRAFATDKLVLECKSVKAAAIDHEHVRWLLKQAEWSVAFDYLGQEENAQPWRFYLRDMVHRSASPEVARTMTSFTNRREQRLRFTSSARAHAACYDPELARVWLERNAYTGKIIAPPRVLRTTVRCSFVVPR